MSRNSCAPQYGISKRFIRLLPENECNIFMDVNFGLYSSSLCDDHIICFIEYMVINQLDLWTNIFISVFSLHIYVSVNYIAIIAQLIVVNFTMFFLWTYKTWSLIIWFFHFQYGRKRETFVTPATIQWQQ